jgi:hypothetical protein
MRQWNESWSPSPCADGDERISVLENELAWTERAYVIMTSDRPTWWFFVRSITSPRLTTMQKEYWNSLRPVVRNCVQIFVFSGHQASVDAVVNFDFGSSPNFYRFKANYIPPVQGDDFTGGMMNAGIHNPFRTYVTDPIKERIKQEHKDWDTIDREMKLIDKPTPTSSPVKGQDGKKDHPPRSKYSNSATPPTITVETLKAAGRKRGSLGRPKG